MLQILVVEIQADMVVLKNGTDTHTSIVVVVKAAPNKSSCWIIIYIRVDRYNENFRDGEIMMNLMFISDGKSKIVIGGSWSVTHFGTFESTIFDKPYYILNCVEIKRNIYLHK